MDSKEVSKESISKSIYEFFYGKGMSSLSRDLYIPTPISIKNPQESMEEWEARRKSELDKLIPDGYHEITASKMIVGTGKGGVILFQIALEKEFMKKYTDEK